MENLKLLRKLRKTARQEQNVSERDLQRSVMFQSYYYAISRDLDFSCIDDQYFQPGEG